VPRKSKGPRLYLRKRAGRDAWKNKFGFESDGTEYEITSFGKNKRPGGEGIDADISSKNIK
jgi:general secretion pathway protein G